MNLPQTPNCRNCGYAGRKCEGCLITENQQLTRERDELITWKKAAEATFEEARTNGRSILELLGIPQGCLPGTVLNEIKQIIAQRYAAIAERDEARRELADLRKEASEVEDLLWAAPELNPNNYTEEQCLKLNQACIDAYKQLKAALAGKEVRS